MTDPSFAALQEAPPPPIDRVHQRVGRRRTVRRLGAGAGVLAAVLVVGLLVGRQDGVRERGIDAAPLVSFAAVAEGPRGPRALKSGDAVGAEERVVFFVRSSIPASAEIRELGPGGTSTIVYPPTGSWQVGADDRAPGGAEPLSWRPDRAEDVLRYEVVVCPEEPPSPCTTDHLELRWAP